jgi:hypothetical protein
LFVGLFWEGELFAGVGKLMCKYVNTGDSPQKIENPEILPALQIAFKKHKT